MLSQRRRWLNGSFFAAINGIVKFPNIYRTSHSFARKFWIHVELLYQIFNLIFTWFSLVRCCAFFLIQFVVAVLSYTCTTAHWLQGNFYIAFFVLTNALEDPTILGGKRIQLINTMLEYSYGGLLLACFILSLGSRPRGSNKRYTLAFIGFAILTVYMTVCFTLFANGCSD